MRKYIILVAFLCIIATVSHAEERWALLVGIDEYSSEIITPLRGAVRDARALRDTLVNYAKFPADNVFCLTSDDDANLPTLGNMVTKLRYIATKVKPGDVFVFFFAGHGINFKGQNDLNEQNYLLVYESDIRDDFILPKTSFSVKELNEYLEKIQSGNTILILDACRNRPGAGRGDEDNLLSESMVNALAENIDFSTTIYSCNTGERAYEWPGRGRGFFSITLEEALTGKADSNQDGAVTISEVELYLSNRVPDAVARELGSGKTQTPRIVRGGDARAGNKVLSWTAGAQQTETTSQPSDVAVVSRELATEPTPQPQSEVITKEAPKEEPTDQTHSEISEIEDSEEKTEKPLSKSDIYRQRAMDAFSELDWETPEPEVDEKETNEEKIGLMPLTQGEKAEGWVDATGECYGANLIPADAQKNALERARRNAIEVALDAQMRVQGTIMRSLRDFHQSFIAVNQFSIYGEIIEEKAPFWEDVRNIQLRPTDPPVPLYQTTLRARISQKESQRDPGFSIHLSLNNATFLDGEEMVLSITPTQDCYVTVFNILSDHTVLVLDTYQGDKPPAVSGKKTSFIPSEEEIQSGKHFRVALPEGRTEEVESVLVIATKDYVPFLSGKAKESCQDSAVTGRKEVLAVLPTYQSALEEINRWLVGIPLEKRSFDIKEYRIIKK